jgi:hypothetical protein
MRDSATFLVGDRVTKFAGDYGGPGIVKAVVPHGDSHRYMVAHKIEGGFGEFLHIYSEHQLRGLDN